MLVSKASQVQTITRKIRQLNQGILHLLGQPRLRRDQKQLLRYYLLQKTRYQHEIVQYMKSNRFATVAAN